MNPHKETGENELEQIVSDVTESPAYKEALSNDIQMRLRSGVPFEGEILPDVLRRALAEAYQAGIQINEESKNNAYHERNMLVATLTKLFPAYLARHDDKDLEWENDWRWIVYIDLPTGQVSWHIHDSERSLFDHLEVKENKWDGHNTERKYQRLMALTALDAELHGNK